MHGFIGPFSAFINFAVLGNIAMMSFTPSGGTRRGRYGKISCIVLTIWLTIEMMSVNWATVQFENEAFVFIASPFSWVFAHALYRLSLLSLPAFASLKYLVTEPCSLGLMYLFWRDYGIKASHPVSFYFGYADTVVAASMSLVSALSEEDSQSQWSYDSSLQPALDRLFVPVHIGILCYTGTKLFF